MSSRITVTKTSNAEDGTDNMTIFIKNVTTAEQGLFTCLLNGLPPVSVSQYIYVDGLFNWNKTRFLKMFRLNCLDFADRKSKEDASISLRSTPGNEFFRVLGQQSIIPCRPVHPSIGMDISKLAKNGQSDEVKQINRAIYKTCCNAVHSLCLILSSTFRSYWIIHHQTIITGTIPNKDSLSKRWPWQTMDHTNVHLSGVSILRSFSP